LGIKKTVLIGHSMGGKTATLFASLYPEKLSSLIIVDIIPFECDDFCDTTSKLEAEHKEILSSLQNLDVKSIKNREELDDRLSAYFNSQSLRNFFAKSIKRNAEGRFEWQLNIDAISKNINEIMKPVLYRGMQPKIVTPTLLIGGELSNYMPKYGICNADDFFENHRFSSIPNAGHWLHAENPKDFLASILNFLNSSPL